MQTEYVNSALGLMWGAWDNAGSLQQLRFVMAPEKTCVTTAAPPTSHVTPSPQAKKLIAAIAAYAEGDHISFEGFCHPGALQGTPFQRRVWQALCTIPFGETATYGELAQHAFESKRYTRAVASAVARNPVTLIVPCHRIVGAHGSLGGYAWGLERKAQLLAMERSAPA